MSLSSVVTFFFLMFSAIISHAQDPVRIFIEAGQPIAEVLTPAKRYRYQEFKLGKVLFIDGTVAEAKLNYSYINGEIEFIDELSDTLAIADEQIPLIKKILIDTTSFFFNKGNDNCFLEEVVAYPEAGKLLKKQWFVVTDKQKIGAYSMASSTTSIQAYSGIVSHNRRSVVSNLVSNENLALEVRTDFFLANKFNEIMPASKKNLLKLYSSKRREINKYLDEHSVNFTQQSDLTLLLFSITKE
jgi:hypothetical protein